MASGVFLGFSTLNPLEPTGGRQEVVSPQPSVRGMSVVLKEFASHQLAVRRLVTFDRDTLDYVLEELRAHVERNKKANRTNPDRTERNFVEFSILSASFHSARATRLSLIKPSYYSAPTSAHPSTPDFAKGRLTFTFGEIMRFRFQSERSRAGGTRPCQRRELAGLEEHPQNPFFSKVLCGRDGTRRNRERHHRCTPLSPRDCSRGRFANEQTVKQLIGAIPRSLKLDLGAGDRIQVNEVEIESVSETMAAYRERLDAATRKATKGPD
jgi:hypothetical protein